ncbi:hypothetical protein EMA8858_00454 [Emticicia aquatica]|jgi:hypothetical protein|uniref:Uncharacterized protein n=1 Tax=Emticicia aquatica TaxID=1681835 RepID=A0ABN8ENB6_9BACT|nr:hypothetical protein [Emticicia aquatica]CAH0994345.1 hypothetical protein EMA8858_00454 [Emticicia aquatica]
MQYSISQDQNGTHLDWQHKNVSPEMIDWFWSNMEKGFLLWHPEEHEPLQWVIPPKHGNLIGAVHIAPQTWSDGKRQNLYIRFEDFNSVPDAIKQYIEYDHCIIVAGLGFGEGSLHVKEPLGYRIHQWQSDVQNSNSVGVIGKSNAFGWKKSENHEQGMIWAKHAGTEISNWGLFLPQLFDLYKVVKNTKYNPFMDLSVKRIDGVLQYKTAN